MTDIKVTQADREAAKAQYIFQRLLGPKDYRTIEASEKISSGAWDDKPAVQAFARHRIEAQRPLLEALMLAYMAGANLLAELDASDAEFEPEDQAVIEGAREDLTTARAALGEQK